jgi:hypothetical protein
MAHTARNNIMMEMTTRVLYGLAALLLLVALALRIAPAPVWSVSLGGAGRTGSGISRPGVAGDSAQAAAAVVQGNVFSASRSAPGVRFVPPDLVPTDTDRPSHRRPPATRLRLFGTVVGPSGTAALIDADPAVRGAEIYQVGDMVDGKEIVAVSESTVVLTGTGGSGRTVLRLKPTSLPDR